MNGARHPRRERSVEVRLLVVALRRPSMVPLEVRVAPAGDERARETDAHVGADREVEHVVYVLGVHLEETPTAFDLCLALCGLKRSIGDRVVPGSNPAAATSPCFGTLAIPFTPLCQYLSEETLKVVGPFYLVSMPGEVKDPTQGVDE